MIRRWIVVAVLLFIVPACYDGAEGRSGSDRGTGGNRPQWAKRL